MDVLQKKVTWSEFKDLEIPEGDTSIYELIHGEIVKRASPNTPHQRTLRKLFFELEAYIRRKKVGELFTAPYDVYFDENTAGVQPDILFISNEREFIIHEDNGAVGAPDLIIEIVSEGSIDKDRIVKKEVYERFAVKEYWIVDPAYKTVEIYKMEDNSYVLAAFAEREGKITSSVLQGFELDVKTIFRIT